MNRRDFFKLAAAAPLVAKFAPLVPVADPIDELLDKMFAGIEALKAHAGPRQRWVVTVNRETYLWLMRPLDCPCRKWTPVEVVRCPDCLTRVYPRYPGDDDGS